MSDVITTVASRGSLWELMDAVNSAHVLEDAQQRVFEIVRSAIERAEHSIGVENVTYDLNARVTTNGRGSHSLELQLKSWPTFGGEPPVVNDEAPPAVKDAPDLAA